MILLFKVGYTKLMNFKRKAYEYCNDATIMQHDFYNVDTRIILCTVVLVTFLVNNQSSYSQCNN